MSFGDVLRATFNRGIDTKSYCAKCQSYLKCHQSRTIESLPRILNLCCNLESNRNAELWRQSDFLPDRVGLAIDPASGALSVYNSDDNRTSAATRTSGSCRNYSLTAILFAVYDKYEVDPSKSDHLAAYIKVSEVWYLFNDFCVVEVSSREVRRFADDWKLPCVVMYSSTDALAKQAPPIASPITADALWTPLSLSRASKPYSFTPLHPSESLRICALDAEFVSLSEEEVKLDVQGQEVVSKPSHQGLGRVSVIRPNGVAFIDDYIHTSEPIADHLTRFSGLSPGDLNPALSTRFVVNLKTVYMKLRYLVDDGVIFVGHGLKNDFRMLDLTVPSTQVIDTVELFYLPREKRKISLRFLAYVILGVTIQSETHDSIEDARTAFMLYRRYLELMEKGEDHFNGVLLNVYRMGNIHKWEVPAAAQQPQQVQLRQESPPPQPQQHRAHGRRHQPQQALDYQPQQETQMLHLQQQPRQEREEAEEEEEEQEQQQQWLILQPQQPQPQQHHHHHHHEQQPQHQLHHHHPHPRHNHQLQQPRRGGVQPQQTRKGKE